MPRGGKRKGAGRKPAIPSGSWLDFEIGAEAEKRWQEQSAKEAAVRLSETPLQEAAAALSSKLGRRLTPDERRAVFGRKGRLYLSASRKGAWRHRRPYGLRLHIIGELAREFSLSERMIERIWKQYRKFLKSLSSE